VRLRNVLGGPEDDELHFTARDLPGASFDPSTQELSFVFRSDQGPVLAATVPANSPGWTLGTQEIAYSDPAGTNGGIVGITLRTATSFADKFRATVDVRASVAAG